MSSVLSKLANLSGNVIGTLPIANGGTGQITASAAFNALSPITATGDIIYSSSGTTNAKLGIGATNTVLQSSGTVPQWGPVVNSGNYAPSFVTNNAGVVTSINITTLGSNNFRWMQIGLVVSVVGAINCNASGAGVADFTCTLPVSSNFTLSSDASGACTVENNDGTTVRSPSGYVMANASATTVRFVGTIGNSGSEIFRFTFMYNIK